MIMIMDMMIIKHGPLISMDDDDLWPHGLDVGKAELLRVEIVMH